MPPERQSPNRTLLSLVAGAVAYSFAQTMILPALPAIQEETGTSEAAVTWLLTGFLLVASVAPPLVGRLGDMFGKERLLLLTLLVFAIGSLVCALGSSSLVLLIAGRVIQGVGGAVFPLSFGIVRDEFPRERVATSIGIVSAVFGIGGGFGLVLAGIIVDHLTVAWLFWASLLTTAVAAWATWRWVPESPVRAPAKIDWGGGALLTVALIAVLLGVSQGPEWGWTAPGVLVLIASGLVLIGVFTVYETRVPQPLVDMQMMARRAVWSPNVAAFAIGFAMFGSFILVPQITEAPHATGYGFGLSATGAGLVMLPSAVVMLVFGPVAGWMGSRFGSRLPLVLGALCAAGGFAILTFAHGALGTIVAGNTLLGVGIAMALAAMANLVVIAVEPTETGVATGINTIMRNIGGAVGGQITASLLAAHVIAGGVPAESGYTAAFAMSGVASLVALAVCFLIPTRRRRAAAPVQRIAA
ncbi:MAG: MFS transporter [Solirubrobacterales bacterium]